MLTKKRVRYTKEQWEARQKVLPPKKRFVLSTTPEVFADMKTWILKACALNNQCKEKYLNGKLNEFEKGVGL